MSSLISKVLTFGAVTGLTPLNIAIVVAILAVCLIFPRIFKRGHAVLSLLAGAFDRHPVAVIVFAALVPLVGRAMLLSSHPIPSPSIHDEFSYLLASDTFAHGKVTNPSHPLFQFFETYHVLPQPTYMSKYLPAQGLLLAAGQVLFGHPWWGEFLSIGLMVGCMCWMLQGWFAPSWALLGSLAAALQFGIGHAWMNSYWGGAPAAIGACLTLGAFARLQQYRVLSPHMVRNAILFGVGIAVLLNSRPWEGIAAILPAGIVSIAWIFKTDAKLRVQNALIPALGVLVVVGAGMLYYNFRVTGNALTMPYTTVHKTYSVAPLFVWQKRTEPPEYRHDIMRRFYTESEPNYQDANKLTTFQGWLSLEPSRLRMTKDLLFGNFFLLLCVLMVFAGQARSHRLLFLTLGVFLVALALESWNQIHYFGPVIGIAAVLKIASLRWTSSLTFGGRQVGAALATAIVLASAIRLTEDALEFPNVDAFALQRADVAHDLASRPGSHVVFVRYSDAHSPSEEWVYNSADIDASKVVWAREMKGDENRKLFEYFKGRKFWLIQPDISPRMLEPLSGELDSALQSGAALTRGRSWQ